MMKVSVERLKGVLIQAFIQAEIRGIPPICRSALPIGTIWLPRTPCVDANFQGDAIITSGDELMMLR